jgi:ABC-type Na+ efflux pump permease subunit
MDLSNSWAVALKDFSIFRKKKYVLYSLVIIPILASIGFPALIQFLISNGNVTPGELSPADIVTISGVFDAFSFFFIIIAALLPVTLASYSIIGEKVEKSLEPLLATRMTDSEILVGKSLAAFLPALASTYVGAVIFMVLMDATTHSLLGFFFFPNWNMAVTLLLLIPVTCLFSVELNLIISSRINDIRAATQLGLLALIPFGVVYVMVEVSYIQINVTNLLILFAAVLVADIALSYLLMSLFRREEILTKWK